jgi:hypothetical protein
MGENKKNEIPGAKAFAEGLFVAPFLHSGVADAYDEITAAINIRTPVVGVAGPPGCGSTTIATAALGTLGDTMVIDLSASDGDLIAAAAVILGGKRQELPRLLGKLEADDIAFLVDGPAVSKAEALSDQVGLLLQLAGRPSVIVLAGAKAPIEQAVNSEHLTIRGAMMVEVGPMRPEETGKYLVSRLSQSSLAEDIFMADSAVLMGSAAAGVPAKINAIARRALAVAWMSNSRVVGMQEVSAAITPVDIDGL